MQERRKILAFLAVGTFVCGTGRAAAPSGDAGAAEAAVRKADGEWAAAAQTAGVDAWMQFYTSDAVVMAPNVRIASEPGAVRQTVADLLALPRLSIAWHPLKVEVAAGGDLAYLIGVYELSYGGPSGRESDRGKLLEIWRRQTDGGWKCVVDTWNSDGPAAAVAESRTESRTESPSTSQDSASEYGDMPTAYEKTVRQYFQKYLKKPESVRYRQITQPEKGYVMTVTGAILSRETRMPGWTVTATIDAANSRGDYVGFKTYTFLFRGEKIVHTVSPLPGDEMR